MKKYVLMNVYARLYQCFTTIRLAVKARKFRGTALHCPLCGFGAASFLSSPDGKRQQVRCPRCDSLERHRAQWLYGLKALPYTADQNFTLLHFTPEFCTTRCVLKACPSVSYLTSAYPQQLKADYAFDVQRILLPDSSVEVVICNHVLEHVEDDHRALGELFRIPKPDGFAFIQVPVDPNRTETFEDASVTDPQERLRLFGQEDHLRVYGMDFEDRLRAVGFLVTVHRFWETMPQDECRRYALTDREPVFTARKPQAVTTNP